MASLWVLAFVLALCALSEQDWLMSPLFAFLLLTLFLSESEMTGKFGGAIMRILHYISSLSSECEDRIYFDSLTMSMIFSDNNHLHTVIVLKVAQNIVDIRINETLPIGEVGTLAYRGRKCLFIFRIHHNTNDQQFLAN